MNFVLKQKHCRAGQGNFNRHGMAKPEFKHIVKVYLPPRGKHGQSGVVTLGNIIRFYRVGIFHVWQKTTQWCAIAVRRLFNDLSLFRFQYHNAGFHRRGADVRALFFSLLSALNPYRSQ